VQSFVYLASQGFFDSVMFHRVEPGFVIQGGGYKEAGSVNCGYTLPAEFSDTLKHDDGILSMARTNDPNSASSQFFICLGPAPHLDKNYTIFGRVVEGLDVAHNIEKSPIRALNPDSPKGMQMHGPITPVYMTKVYLEKKP
jgi:cyclophilin family peptidyl-prolyl cis-trans isomerase